MLATLINRRTLEHETERTYAIKGSVAQERAILPLIVKATPFRRRRLFSRYNRSMHEMSLVEGVRGLIEDAARREGFARVRGVRVEIGQLSGVEREAFEFCFDLAMRGTLAGSARLDILATPGRGRCAACGRETALAAVFDPCEHCGGFPVAVVGGTEMRVIDLEVE